MSKVNMKPKRRSTPGKATRRAGRATARKIQGAGAFTRADFERLAARIEILEDSVFMRDAEARGGPSADAVGADAVKAMLSGAHPVRIWREHRGLTLSELAGQAGIPVGYLSEIETGKKPGSVAAYQKIASALSLAVDDILPAAA
jgi:DNA-binding XRE family transcriptional regulator